MKNIQRMLSFILFWGKRLSNMQKMGEIQTIFAIYEKH